MRTLFVAANWKMNKTVQQALTYVTEFRQHLREITGIEVVIAPPFTAVHAVAGALLGTPVGVAGQDLYWEDQGAFTGEINAMMLKEAGASYVLIGHSERRQLFSESDDNVNVKVRAALDAQLTPILCVGESLDQRESNRTFEVLDRQLTKGLTSIPANQVGTLIVAYEPIWAIGTGLTATPPQAQEAHAHIRECLALLFTDDVASSTRIIYGGSVKLGNVADLLSQSDIDGALIGGASLDSAIFAEIVATSRTPTV